MAWSGRWRNVRSSDDHNQREMHVTEIQVTRTTKPQTPPADETLSFGNVFSDHMFMMDYLEGKLFSLIYPLSEISMLIEIKKLNLLP